MAQNPKSTFVENKLQQISLPGHIRTDNTTIDFVTICLYEWITDKTKNYLQNNSTTTISINPQQYQQLVNKLDLEDMKSADGSRPEKKLPTLDELQKTAAKNQYEIKVKEFFYGKESTTKEVRSLLNMISNIHLLNRKQHHHHL